MNSYDRANRLPTQVRQTARALRESFGDLIDMSDFESSSEDDQRRALLSRGLAAQAVRMVTGWDAADAAACVIDGRDDNGIDAIAVTSDPGHVYLVQAKWSDKGQASAKTEAVLKMFEGLRLIDDEESAQFNPRGELLAERAKAVLTDGIVGVTLVHVLMGTEKPSKEVRQCLANGEREFNSMGEWVGHRFLFAEDVWNWMRRHSVPDPVTMSVGMSHWYSLDVPHRAFHGVVPAEHVAGWLDAFGPRLFERNIRNPLAGTLTNEEIVTTLTEEPSLFWYFNNGITVLCDKVEPVYSSMKNARGGPVTLRLTDASVVNGAQTVRAIQRALEQGDGAADAQVSVRVIETGGGTEFASHTTRATNRQNRVEARDFVALDPVQADIRADLRAELGLSYWVRRGGLPPQDETGCSVDEAAVALACAHPNPRYASRASASLDTLWARGGGGTYDVLFRPQPNAFQVWRSVLAVRRIRKEISDLRRHYEGRAAAVLEHGTYVLCHLVFQWLGAEGIDEPDDSWENAAWPRLAEGVKRQLALLVEALDNAHPRGQVQAILADPDKCGRLADTVSDVQEKGGDQTAEVSPRYIRRVQQAKRKRPNAVATIIDRGAIKESAPLRFFTSNGREQRALADWLKQDPSRGRATWTSHRTKPLVWEADGRRYSPTGLVKHMWKLARWEDCPVANQGTRRWLTAEGTSLFTLATTLQDATDSD